MAPNSEDFNKALGRLFDQARARRQEYIDVVSRDLHTTVGGYPGRNHAMPNCCRVMKKRMKTRDKILEQPPSGQGATLVIRYYLDDKGE